jgi:hypothetical protein
MSEPIGQEAFETLFEDLVSRSLRVEKELGLILPANCSVDSVWNSSGEGFNEFRWIVTSLDHTLRIVQDHSEDSTENRAALIQDLQDASKLDGFWRACATHGDIVGLKNRTNATGNRQRFLDNLEPEIALQASLILESIAMTYGSKEAHGAVLSKNADLIAELIKRKSFPSIEFIELLALCSSPNQQIQFALPTRPEDIVRNIAKKNLLDIARSCWISHHLWAMDRHSLADYLGKGTAKELKQCEKFTAVSGEALYRCSNPPLSDFDRNTRKFNGLTGSFQPRFDLLPTR